MSENLNYDRKNTFAFYKCERLQGQKNTPSPETIRTICKIAQNFLTPSLFFVEFTNECSLRKVTRIPLII